MIKAFRELVDVTLQEVSSIFLSPSKKAELVMRLSLPYEQLRRRVAVQGGQLEIAKEALKYYADGSSPIARLALKDMESLNQKQQELI